MMDFTEKIVLVSRISPEALPPYCRLRRVLPFSRRTPHRAPTPVYPRIGDGRLLKVGLHVEGKP